MISLRGLFLPPDNRPFRLSPLHFGKRAVRQGLWPLMQRYAMFPRAIELPPAPVKGDGRFCVHVRVCEADSMMLRWMLQTLIRACQTPFDLTIHDDGSLRDATAESLEAQFPGARLIRRAEAAQTILPALERHPLLKAWWPKSYVPLKWLDPYLLGASEYVIMLDSDVLFFSDPIELFSADPRPVWMRDSSYMLLVEASAAKCLFGVHPLVEINSGVGRVPRSLFRLDLAERVFAVTGETADDQTVNAVISAQRSDCALLPFSYRIATERGLEGLICKHYTTPFRFMYFEEGIPRAARLLGMSLPWWLKERP